MLTLNDDLQGALINYLKLIDQEEYFGAHEVLEEAWHPLRLKKHPLANLIKGFINGAIAFEHIKRNGKNKSGKAKRVMASYERHIHLCTKDIAHAELFEEARRKIEALKVKHKEVFVFS